MIFRLFWYCFAFLVGGSFLLPLPGKEERFDGYPLISSGNLPYIPEQYFEKKDRPDNWQLLFPHNPEFRYAFLFVPSFENELGFYLEGKELHWARLAGRTNSWYSSNYPVFKMPGDFISPRHFLASSVFNSACIALSAGRMCLCICFWDIINSETYKDELMWCSDPFQEDGARVSSLHGTGGNNFSFQSFVFSSLLVPFCSMRSDSTTINGMISALMSGYDEALWETSFLKEMLKAANTHLYTFLSTWRGSVTLHEDTAEELRKTWDLVAGKRTFPMEYYKGILGMLDGRYSYYRGSVGPVAEDIWLGKSPLRSGMSELSFAIMDMAAMGNCGEESQKWIREKCRKIRKYASEIGDAAPPFCSPKWAEAYFYAYHEKMERARIAYCGLRERPVKDSNFLHEEKNESEEEYESEREKMVRSYIDRFKKNLKENPYWDYVFPGSGDSCPAGLIMTLDLTYAFYIKDGMLAYTETYRSPVSEFSVAADGKEAVLPSPYEMANSNGELVPYVKRNWLLLSRGEERLLIAILDKTQKMLSGAGPGEDNEENFYPVVTCRDSAGKSVSVVIDDERKEKLMEVLRKAIQIYVNREVRIPENISRLSSLYEELDAAS